MKFSKLHYTTQHTAGQFCAGDLTKEIKVNKLTVLCCWHRCKRAKPYIENLFYYYFGMK